MKVLLLGVGMQGKATLHDLARCAVVSEIIAADMEVEALKAHVAGKPYGSRVRCEHVDGASDESVNRLFAQGVDVAIDLLPVSFHLLVAASAVEHGVHLVNASYATPELAQLSDKAKERDVTILPEFGMDPGLDLVLLGEAVRSLDVVEAIFTYGAGIPEPEAADNPLKYKITWTLEGVLRSYTRAGRLVRDGKILEIPPSDIFNPEHIHEVYCEGLGRLEAIPNGDALKYVELLGIDAARLREAGRYTLRWPGHSAFWRIVSKLHLLDDEPVTVDGIAVDRRRFLAAAIGPHIQYRDNERDVAIIRVDVQGMKDGQRKRVVLQIVDRRDLETGFSAMSRTVGYTASIGALMIGRGQITKRGVLSPISDVPYQALVREIAERRILVTVDLIT